MTTKPKSSFRKNLAIWDRVLRFAVALFIIVGFFMNYIPAEFAIPLLAVAGALAVNSAMGICGLYSFLGFSTCPIPQEKKTDSVEPPPAP